jgi:hypothetical protein
MREMSRKELGAEMEELAEGYPKARIPLPKMMSKRPVFRG